MVEAMLTRDYNTHITDLQDQIDELMRQQQYSKETTEAGRQIQIEHDSQSIPDSSSDDSMSSSHESLVIKKKKQSTVSTNKHCDQTPKVESKNTLIAHSSDDNGTPPPQEPSVIKKVFDGINKK